jgi:predicted nucleic acid-binding protein
VILDVVTDDPRWGEWSSSMLTRCVEGGTLVINPIIYAEISIGFERIEELDEVLPADSFRRDPLPWEAAFLAGKCFLEYRRRGGSRRSPLPDFYIGAHAAVAGLSLLTRDARRYRTYFPHLNILAPTKQEEESR